jgi:hypothetical protein
VKSLAVLLVLILASVGLAQAPPSAQKPLDKDQVMTLVTAGMDNAQLAKKIEQLGIDFEPTDDYLQALRKAGAQDVLIDALRAFRKPEPMNQKQVLELVAGGVPSERAAALVKQRGIDFVADEKYLETLRVAGADETLIAALREASAAIPGKLEVATSPNAEVYLDGSPAGRADYQGNLELKKVRPGAHTLRATLATKRDFEQSITVAAGVTSKITAPLTDLPGKIVISSMAGAEVYLDGASRGKIDASGKLALTDLPPGSHQLRVTAQGKKDYEQSVSVSAGQESPIQAQLQDLPGTIRVRATPGAKVYLDAYYPVVANARGEVTLVEVRAGTHSIRVVTQGQAEFRRDVAVAPGQEATLDAPRGEYSTGKRIDRLYRTVSPDNNLWYYYRFFPDGIVVWANSAGSGPESVASVEREIAVWHDSKGETHAYTYQMQGSTIRFSVNDMFGAIDYTATLRGNTLTVEAVTSSGHRSVSIYQAVSSAPSAAQRRRK